VSQRKQNQVSVLYLVFLSLSLTAGFPILFVQDTDACTESASSIQDQPTGCEYNEAVLDGLAQKNRLDDLIIVISRLGDKDRRPDLNYRRLNNVRVYLTEYLTDPSVQRKRESLLLAQGERVPGLGRIELYVGGKLLATLRMRPDGDLLVANCGRQPPENPCPHQMRNLYPCRDKSVKNAGRK
jgi:hypothetical protein